MGRIKDCVQSNTPCTSCQRGCTAFPFSPCSVHVRHRNILSSLLSYIKALSDSSSPLHTLALGRRCLPALISLQPIASACRCPGKLFFRPASSGGSKLKLTGLLMRQGESLCSAPSPLRAQSRTGDDIYTGPCSPSVYLPQQREKRVCVHITCVRQALSVCRLN